MKKLTLIIIATLSITLAHAQSNVISSANNALIEDLDINVVGAFGEILTEENSIKNNTPKTEHLVPGFYRAAKPIADNFTGYTVQILTTNRELDKEDELFVNFGGIMIQENLYPRYSYLVGKFRTKEGAEKYVNTVISERYSNAKVIAFKNGKRVKKLR